MIFGGTALRRASFFLTKINVNKNESKRITDYELCIMNYAL